MKHRNASSSRRRQRAWALVIAIAVGLLWALPALAETATTRPSDAAAGAEVWGDEAALDALAWSGWVGWVLLMSLVSLQYWRQRRLARELLRLERSLGDLEKLAEGAKKES